MRSILWPVHSIVVYFLYNLSPVHITEAVNWKGIELLQSYCMLMLILKLGIGKLPVAVLDSAFRGALTLSL